MDSGPVLLTGFPRVLERSNCVSLKKSYRVRLSIRVASMCGCLVIVLYRVVVCSFRVVLMLSYLGTSYPLSPLLCPLPAASYLLRGLCSSSEPVGRMAGVSRGPERHTYPLRHADLRHGLHPCFAVGVLWVGSAVPSLCVILTIPRKSVYSFQSVHH